ncbi:MAG: hypothetical protein EOP83_22440 [Verrucomicrobiaceae bacterium]|nr:MAG: hypothetical protein EOP83_22440 [Verrucomicrobiaceae bacterium]
MTKENLKTIAAVMAALAWCCLLIAGLWELLGNVILWLLLAGLLSIVALLIITPIKRRRLFRRKGYEVLVTGEHEFLYREQDEGGIRELPLPGDLIEVGHPVYSRLSWKDWETMAPDWARNRQLEIEARIHENPFYRADGG